MSITEASLVIKNARNAAIATDHTLESVFMKAGTATHPKELIDSFSPNFLNAPGMQTTCKWQPSPSIDGIVDKLELWYDLKNNSGSDSVGVSNHLLMINFLSCVVNSQEVVRYSGEGTENMTAMSAVSSVHCQKLISIAFTELMRQRQRGIPALRLLLGTRRPSVFRCTLSLLRCLTNCI